METVQVNNEPSVDALLLKSPLYFPYARIWMSACLAAADMLSLGVVMILVVNIWNWVSYFFRPEFYWSLAYLMLVFVVVYALRGLYPSLGLSPAEELKRLSVSTTFVFLGLAALTFWLRTPNYYSRGVFGLSWIFALVAVPLGRFAVRWLLVKANAWGEMIAIVGCGPEGQQIYHFLSKNPRYGLIPKLMIDGGGCNEPYPEKIPVIAYRGQMNCELRRHLEGINTAILVTPEITPPIMQSLVEKSRLQFKNIVLVTRLNQMGTIGITSYDIGGMIGLEVCQNLLNPWMQATKRLMDIGLVVFGGGLILPVLAGIAVLVKLSSKGSVLYRQERIGLGGKRFSVIKFRTMVTNADQILADYLKANPHLKDEWEAKHKLAHDPRVTPVGRVLRKLSLDELPQLWNVLVGDMSLVGPRPIVADEIKRYEGYFHLYSRVRPGITGMWQVSGRSGIDYQDRVKLDDYYVRNWSIWLDIYILARTIWAVLTKDGAC
ncbi:MAG: undecaprenyl-phosphate galactose phosphotransferase WbaP [Chloroflexi bacterium]|nr:undecaprenyl-phosphate galactose phosphotransferase WbaP [Chloroflexota bacterium]